MGLGIHGCVVGHGGGEGVVVVICDGTHGYRVGWGQVWGGGGGCGACSPATSLSYLNLWGSYA
jgi:hypothetical protein